jgi:hypothetical protein
MTAYSSPGCTDASSELAGVRIARDPLNMYRLAAIRAIVRGVCTRRLTLADCRLLACVRLFETLALAAVACAPIPAVRRAFSGMRRWAVVLRGPSSEDRVLWAFESSARWRAGRSTCLGRMLAAELLLPVGERPLTLVIGVSQAAGGPLRSHAWIERDDRILIGGNTAKREYVRLIAWTSGAA